MTLKHTQLSTAARHDLARLWEYRASYSESSADELIRGLWASFQMLCEAPRAGRSREELGADIRSFVSLGHVVVYRLGTEALEVLRVVSAKEDWESQF